MPEPIWEYPISQELAQWFLDYPVTQIVHQGNRLELWVKIDRQSYQTVSCSLDFLTSGFIVNKPDEKGMVQLSQDMQNKLAEIKEWNLLNKGA